MKKVLLFLIVLAAPIFASNTAFASKTQNCEPIQASEESFTQQTTAYVEKGNQIIKVPIRVKVVDKGFGNSSMTVTSACINGRWGQCNSGVAKCSRGEVGPAGEIYMYKVKIPAYVLDGRWAYFNL